MKKQILSAIMVIVFAGVCAAQNKAAHAGKPGAGENANKAAQAERAKNFQAVKDLNTKESAEVRAYADTVAATRKRQQGEIKAALEQMKNLRKKHQAELQDLAKQEKSLRDRHNSEKAALMKNLAPASAQGQKKITPNSMIKPAPVQPKTGK